MFAVPNSSRTLFTPLILSARKALNPENFLTKSRIPGIRLRISVILLKAPFFPSYLNIKGIVLVKELENTSDEKARSASPIDFENYNTHAVRTHTEKIFIGRTIAIRDRLFRHKRADLGILADFPLL